MSAVRRATGFGLPALVGLAALAAPRAVLHDLDVIHEGTLLNAVFVIVAPVCWIAAVLWRRPPRPFVTVVAVGAVYGVFLAAVHQLFWASAFATPPTLGGNLADLDPAAQEALMRAAAVLSSLATGLVTGVVVGAVAALLCRLLPAGARGQARNVRR